MPDNKNQPENEEEKISRVGEAIECQYPDCTDWALSLSCYCWEHIDDKEGYREKIQEWAKAGKLMQGFVLTGVDLSGAQLKGSNLLAAYLVKANLSRAWLVKANLFGAWLVEANLSGAELLGANLSAARLEKANLVGAEFGEANLSGAGLGGANLSRARLGRTNLSWANLKGANLVGAWLIEANLFLADLKGANLAGADFYKAHLSMAAFEGSDLTNTRLFGAKLTGAIGLSKENFSQKLTEKEKKEASEFKGSYLTVKNYFIQSGRYDDASWAAFRERTLERIALAKQIKLKWKKGLFSWTWWKSSFRWFGFKIISLLNGYGERPLRVIISSVAIVMGFSLFYFFSKCIESNPPNGIHWWDYLYFSIVTFTTLGYGDIRPMSAPLARMVASMEAFVGAFMIALFVWTLARRYVAR